MLCKFWFIQVSMGVLYVCARARVRVAISPFALHLLNITRHINGNHVHSMRAIIFYASLGLPLS